MSHDLDDLPDEIGPDGLHPSADVDKAVVVTVVLLLGLLGVSIVGIYAILSFARSLLH